MLPARPASSAARVWDVSEQGQALLAVLFPHLSGLACTGWKTREARW
jgi:hypothetical protein